MQTILITRPLPQGEDTAAALRAQGYHVLLSPAIELVASLDAGAMIAAIAQQADTVIVTSQCALSLLAQHCLPKDTPLLFTGERLATIAREQGFQQVACGAGNVESLLPMIDDPAQRYVYAHGNPITSDIVSMLQARGITITGKEIYHALPARSLRPDAHQALQKGEVDAVWCYSVHTARSFMALCEAAALPVSTVHAICISEAVALALPSDQWKGVMVSPSPALEDMLACTLASTADSR